MNLVLLASQGLLNQSGSSWQVYTYNSPGIFAIYINPAVPFEQQLVIQNKIKTAIAFLAQDPSFGIATTYVGPRAVRQAQLRGYPGAYAIMEAKIGWAFSPNKEGLLLFNNTIPTYQASHGYNPAYPEMLTNFM